VEDGLEVGLFQIHSVHEQTGYEGEDTTPLEKAENALSYANYEGLDLVLPKCRRWVE
jgi:hypothetical protein